MNYDRQDCHLSGQAGLCRLQENAMPLNCPPRYTLIIPTYNRPTLLRSLLGYFAARNFSHPIRVLDSSLPENLTENRASVSQCGLNIDHQTYDNAIDPTIKLMLGAKSVETPYCSFCSDDDLLFTDQIEGLLDHLDATPTSVAAHGYYLNFRPAEHFEISDTVYSAPSIAGNDALKRIVEQMTGYEAVFYAIHRTGIMQSVLPQMMRVQSALSRELLASSLTLIAGGVHRSPVYFMARNTAPSNQWTGWHPHQFLATDPEALFNEYAAYRAVVLDHLMNDSLCRATYRPDQMRRIVDLAHLQYLSPMLSAPVIDYMLEESLRPGHEPRDIIAGAWSTFVNPSNVETRTPLGHLKRALSSPQYARRLFNYVQRLVTLFAALRFREKLDVSVGRGADRIWVSRRTRDSRPRRYALLRDFLNRELPGGQHVTSAAIGSVLEQFDDYV